MKSKLAIGLAGLASLAMILTACGQATVSDQSSSDAPSTKDVSLIGVSNLGLSFPFTAAISKGIHSAADAQGVKVIELDAQGKTDKEASDIQDLIGQKPDGVLLLPLDGIVATGLVDQLKSANIPTVAVASQVGDPAKRKLEDVYPGLVALVTQKEVDAGAIAGQLALKALPEGGDYAIIAGSAGFAENTTRVQDFTKAADAAGVKFNLVATQPGDWVPETGQSACQNILASHPGVKLFYALNDDMAVGCAKAVKSASANAIILGIGGSKLGIDAIKSGEIYGTVCYKPQTMGSLAFKVLYDYLTTGVAPDPNFVSYETPGTTKANVDECVPEW